MPGSDGGIERSEKGIADGVDFFFRGALIHFDVLRAKRFPDYNGKPFFPW